MTLDQVRNVLVVGAGRMGWQISLQFAMGGYQVALTDESPEALKRAQKHAEDQAGQMMEDGRWDPDRVEKAFGLLKRTTDLDGEASKADYVVEAIYENVEAKRATYTRLDSLCPPPTVLATTSSSIRCSLLESATKRPDKVVNVHFMPPLWDKLLVEVMRGTETSDDTVELSIGLCRRLGLVPLLVQRESTGFLYNRVWRAIKRESLAVADGGYASFEDVDRAWIMMNSTRNGPFGMMDEIGLDVVLAIEKQYFAESGDEKDRPAHILEEKVANGDLGIKTGKGFYTYPNPAYEKPGWLKQG